MKDLAQPHDILADLQKLPSIEPSRGVDASVIAAARGRVQPISRFEAALNALVGLGFASHVAGYLLASVLR